MTNCHSTTRQPQPRPPHGNTLSLFSILILLLPLLLSFLTDLALAEHRDPSLPLKKDTGRLWRGAGKALSRIGKGAAGGSENILLMPGHWLEATDPSHRYGTNLVAYHEYWLNTTTTQDFFFWLDHGDGRTVDLLPKHSRSKLQQQKVTYLNATEREHHRVVVDARSGTLVYASTRFPVETVKPTRRNSKKRKLEKRFVVEGGSQDSMTEHAKYIYVVDKKFKIYVGEKIKGRFHHSSFLAGGSVFMAGALVVRDGHLREINYSSGHFRPSFARLLDFLINLKRRKLKFSSKAVLPPSSFEENDVDGDEELKKKWDELEKMDVMT